MLRLALYPESIRLLSIIEPRDGTIIPFAAVLLPLVIA